MKAFFCDLGVEDISLIMVTDFTDGHRHPSLSVTVENIHPQGLRKK